MASQISNAVAVLDNKVMDHQWKGQLLNKNYKLLSKMSTCTNGLKFPCDETILANHPKAQNTLECFKRKKITGRIEIEHKCFEGTLEKRYFDVYVERAKLTANKWIKVLSEKVYPGRKCHGYVTDETLSGSYKGFMDRQQVIEACDKVKIDGVPEGEVKICGEVGCCSNLFKADGSFKGSWYLKMMGTNDSAAGCPVDDSLGEWKLRVRGDTCDSEQCELAEFKLTIVWRYNAANKNGEKYDVIKIKSENPIVRGMTDQEMIDGLFKTARKPKDICR